MTRRQRGRRVGLWSGSALLFTGLAFWTGWMPASGGWQAATGWNRVPALERPAPGPLWRAAAGESAPVVEWLGHSGFRIEWAGTVLLIDPNLSTRCTISRRVLAPPLAATALGPIDAALISHAHFDHLDLPTLTAIGALGAVLLPRGSEEVIPLRTRMRTRLLPLAAGDVESIGALEIHAVAAAHNGHRLHPLKSGRRALGYVIRHRDEAVYYSGDTGRGNDFAAIRDRFHPRAAILPIGAYAPRFPLKYYHLSPEEAVDVAVELGVETVVPCHFGTFTLSLDRPAAALPRFAHAAKSRGLRWLMPEPRGGFAAERKPAASLR